MPELVDFSSLFTQLQTRYPTSSLLTEFVQVYEGSFVVRALVQVSGTTLATSLAAAATIEQAEDQARLRVFKLLGIPSTVPAAPLHLPTASYPLPAPPLTNSFENGNNLLTSAPSSPAMPPAPIVAPIPNFSETSPTPISSAPVETPPEPKRSPLPKSRKAVVPSLDEAVEPSFEVEEPLTATMATSFIPEPFDDSSRHAVMEADLEPGMEEMPAPIGEPADLSELIALTDVEMQRVGWNRKRGQTHLKQTYGRDKRADLDEEQLLEFLHFLRALPSRYDTPFQE